MASNNRLEGLFTTGHAPTVAYLNVDRKYEGRNNENTEPPRWI